MVWFLIKVKLLLLLLLSSSSSSSSSSLLIDDNFIRTVGSGADCTALRPGMDSLHGWCPAVLRNLTVTKLQSSPLQDH